MEKPRGAQLLHQLLVLLSARSTILAKHSVVRGLGWLALGSLMVTSCWGVAQHGMMRKDSTHG